MLRKIAMSVVYDTLDYANLKMLAQIHTFVKVLFGYLPRGISKSMYAISLALCPTYSKKHSHLIKTLNTVITLGYQSLHTL